MSKGMLIFITTEFRILNCDSYVQKIEDNRWLKKILSYSARQKKVRRNRIR